MIGLSVRFEDLEAGCMDGHKASKTLGYVLKDVAKLKCQNDADGCGQCIICLAHEYQEWLDRDDEWMSRGGRR